MLARIRKADEKDSGFTLIELLVVMIIIGILAAIAIPVFLNQRKGAVDSAIKSDLRTISVELESAYTDTQVYPASQAASTAGASTYTIGTIVARITKPNVYQYWYDSGTDVYCIKGSAAAGKSNGPWYYRSDAGGLQAKGYTPVAPCA